MIDRPDPLIPCKPGAADQEAMKNRVIWLERLYLIDGRDQPNHPMKGLYTGLHQKYVNTDMNAAFRFSVQHR